MNIDPLEIGPVVKTEFEGLTSSLLISRPGVSCGPPWVRGERMHCISEGRLRRILMVFMVSAMVVALVIGLVT